MSIGTRIAKIRKEKGWSQPELSDRCGWGRTQSRIGNYEQDRSEPKYEDIIRIARALGCNPAYLAFGDSDEDRPSESAENTELVSIARYTHIEQGSWQAPASLLSLFNLPASSAVVEVSDDQMEDRIPKGARVLVDTTNTELAEGSVLALLIDGLVRLRQVEFRPGGKLRLHRLNKAYQAEDVEVGSVEVIGRAAVCIAEM